MSFSPQEQAILQSIIVASENDPKRPEFPPDQPRFPATPTYRIEVSGFSNVGSKMSILILIKIMIVNTGKTKYGNTHHC